MESGDDLLSVAAASVRLGVSRMQIYRLVAHKRLTSIKQKGRVMIHMRAIEQFEKHGVGDIAIEAIRQEMTDFSRLIDGQLKELTKKMAYVKIVEESNTKLLTMLGMRVQRLEDAAKNAVSA